MRTRWGWVLFVAVLSASPARALAGRHRRPGAPALLSVALGPLAGAHKVTGHERHYYVAFTFDDGPNFATTPEVLAALARYDVPATFFVVGHRFVGSRDGERKNARVLDEEIARGYLIGNHTWNHANLRTLDVRAMRATINRNARAIARHLGRLPVLFRPPYGALTGRASAYLRKLGYTVVDWNVDPKDFVFPRRASLRRRVLHAILSARGGVVLMHDTKWWTARTVPEVLDDLEAVNCRRRRIGRPLIVPVSLHYFLRERNGRPRPVPPEVAARTAHYLSALPGRCAARAAARTRLSRATRRAISWRHHRRPRRR